MNIPDTDAAREVLERARDLWAHIEGPRDYVDYPDLPSISSELGAELVGMRSALDAFLDSFGAGEADRSVLTAHAEAISQAETAWRLMRDVRQGGEADPSEAIAAAEASVDALSETGAAVQSIEGGIQTAAIVSAILAIRARVNEELERGSQGFFSDWFSYYNEFRLLEKTLETLETVVRPDPSDVTVEPTEARWTGFRDQAHEDPSLGYVERWVIPWNGTVATPLLDQELVPEQNFDNGPAAVGASFYKEFDGEGNEVYSGEAAAWQR